MLAYINQEEADLLKERGGSGRPHADTGVPSFEDEDLVPLETATPDPTPTSDIPAGPDVSGQGYEPRPVASEYGGYDVAAATPTEVAQPYGADITAAPSYAAEDARLARYAAMPKAPITPGAGLDESLLGRAAKATGLKEETLKKLGISGLQGLFGAYQANKAQEAGQAGKAEMMALAAPYKQQAQDLIAKSQRGELTPVGQQQLQAVQAQAAQGAERRGGVGAQQSMAQVEAFRQQLLQGQYDYGLKLSGIADNIITGAIKTGLQADQYVSSLTNSYFGNMARIMAGVEDKKPTTGA
jgi:hypothetical protein